MIFKVKLHKFIDNIRLCTYKFYNNDICIAYKSDIICIFEVDKKMLYCYQYGSLNRPHDFETVGKQFKHSDGSHFTNYVCQLNEVDMV